MNIRKLCFVCATVFLALAVSSFLLVTPAEAKQTEWSDKTYDFTKIQTVRVEVPEFEVRDGEPNDIMVKLLKEEFEDSIKKKLEGKVALVQGKDAKADLIVTIKLIGWKDGSYIAPAYTSWEPREYTRRRRDGREETYVEYIPYYHPERTINTSSLVVRFDAIDAKTGKAVFSREDDRERDNSNKGQQGMFKRICNSFFGDLYKKISKD